MNFDIKEDVEVVIELLEMTAEDLAAEIGITRGTINNWLSGNTDASSKNVERLYNFAYKKGLRLNKIKEQLYKEEIADKREVLLFHGAKTEIVGELSVNHSRKSLDMGEGFYCGESLEQSAMFVATYPESSLYCLKFDSNGLNGKTYRVDQEWMLLIAYFRNRLGDMADSEKIQSLVRETYDVDYIIAPIADNRMFEIIDSFIDGEITDIQCKHCLSATDLGNQYVFKSEKALKQIELLEKCYLSEAEKMDYLQSRNENASINNDKVKLSYAHIMV